MVLATKDRSDNLADDDVVERARASRDRLGADAIDLPYVHWPIRGATPRRRVVDFEGAP